MAAASLPVSAPIYPEVLAPPVGWLLPFSRCYNRNRAERWRRAVVLLLVSQVLRKDTPYYYQPAFSFLQPGGLDPDHPVTVDLYLPDHSLFLDVLSEAWDEDYRVARHYLTRRAWEEGQEILQYKRDRFREQYHVPYLTIHSHDAVTVPVLRQRLDEAAGISRFGNL